MKFFYGKNEIQEASYVGGKGRQLQLLVSWKLNVPDFFILSTRAFDYFKRHNDFPEEIKKRVEVFFESYPEVSFRSSMVLEDQKETSFAGIFETVLSVQKDQWKEALLRVYRSVGDRRVEEYLKDGKKEELKMAVVVQKMIHSERSGVLFTRSPLSPTSLAVIDAAPGLGEGVVSGRVETDHYQLDRLGNTVYSQVKNQKETLTKNERSELLKRSLYIEEKLGLPADIEWGIFNGEFYFFQARPITREFLPLEYFVDTNLSESYPGVVSPFTADFVKKAYENVFYESAVILGASGKRLENLHHHYKNLLASVDGHLYYNLEHYYAVLKALPGGEKNIKNWHKMIGGEHEFRGIKSYETAPNPIETILSLWRVVKIAFSHDRIFRDLIKNFERLKIEIEEEIEKKNSSQELILLLNELVQKPLGFGYTVVNDIFVMLGLSLLTFFAKKKGFVEEDIMNLLNTSEGVDSVIPLKKLQEMIPSFRPGFLEAFSKEELRPGLSPYTKIFKSLIAQGYDEEVNKIAIFLEQYGERSFEELKLESLPLSHSPEDFYRLISWYKKPLDLEKRRLSEQGEFSGLLRIIHRFVQKAVHTREETRVFRGKFYNLIRILLLKTESALKKEDKSWMAFESADFFSLTAKEWMTFSKEEAQQEIRKRNHDKNLKKNYPEILCWVKEEPLPQFQEEVRSNEMKGQGVSPGEVEGNVLILESPMDAFDLSLENTILVTKNTDPAWVYVMSQSLGLISEKGSLLSHTAIIGRELGIPTIVGLREGTKILKSGERIRMNGRTGEIKRI